MLLPVLAIYVSILLGVLMFSSGLWFYFSNRTRPRNVTIAALLVCSGLWSFAHVLWRASEGYAQQLFWLKTLVFLGLMLPLFFLFYVVTYYRERMPAPILQAAPMLPNMVAFWFIYGTDQVVRLAADGSVVFGPGGVILAMHFGAVYAVSLLVLFIVGRDSRKKEDKAAILTAFGGSILAFNAVFAVLAGVSLFNEMSYLWVASTGLSVGMLMTALPILKRMVFTDLRLVGAELFVILSLTLIVTDIVVSVTLLDFTFRLVLLIVIVFYGVLALRTHAKEVTRLKQIEELNRQIAQLNRSLVKSDKMKTKFLSFASHQLRAPLTGVMSYLSMMRKGEFGKVSKKQGEILELNEEAVIRLRSTIETFLDISKIEMGGLELSRSETRLDHMITEVAESLGPSATKKNIKIRLKIDPKVPRVMVDSGKLYHAITNLVDNAIKYTNRGSVTITLRATREKVYIEVKDTGNGMDAKTKAKVKRVLSDGLEQVRFEREGGSGLGIYIAKKIIEGHGGKVIAKSAGKGKGSTFSFWIPKI